MAHLKQVLSPEEWAQVVAGSPPDCANQFAEELGRHQHLLGPREDDQPAQWFNWCECGWDGGPVESGLDPVTGYRAAFRAHVADELLALPAVAAALDEAEARGRAEVAAKVEALAGVSGDGTEYAHRFGNLCEGEPECPACWVATLRSLIAEKAS